MLLPRFSNIVDMIVLLQNCKSCSKGNLHARRVNCKGFGTVVEYDETVCQHGLNLSLLTLHICSGVVDWCGNGLVFNLFLC